MHKIIILMGFYPNISTASEAKYKSAFVAKVYKFGIINRFNIMNINRDEYANCIMQVRIKATLDKTGKVISTEVTDPSPVPMVNKYFLYIVEQARPYEPLEKYISPVPIHLVIEEYYRLKLNQYEYQKITEPCR